MILIWLLNLRQGTPSHPRYIQWQFDWRFLLLHCNQLPEGQYHIAKRSRWRTFNNVLKLCLYLRRCDRRLNFVIWLCVSYTRVRIDEREVWKHALMLTLLWSRNATSWAIVVSTMLPPAAKSLQKPIEEWETWIPTKFDIVSLRNNCASLSLDHNLFRSI
jgi:hypothetical protein